jgi:isoquinoline 1-oxidoreductase alpha subunit
MPITLKVNGTPRTLDVPADMPLLWALRDELDLKGTKFGCGIARCGACTVHVNGVATRSCNTPLSRVANADVTTIEGLSPDGLHAVQQSPPGGSSHASVRATRPYRLPPARQCHVPGTDG